MASEPESEGSGELYDYIGGNVYRSDQQSLRLRRVSSRVSNQNYPENHLRPTPAEKNEEGNGGPPRELRTIPLPMPLKRAVRQVQQMYVPVVSMRQSWRWRKSVHKLKETAGECLHFSTLWRKSLQKIGGNFGGGVQSYFLFLRFLVVLNFVSFLLIAGFVLIPSIVFRSVGSSLVNSTGPDECMVYDPNSQGLVVFYNYFLDLLSGTGFMEYSYLFYGYYNNTMVEDQNFSYNIPLAYLFTAVFYFVFCLICIIARMGTAARVAVATGGGSVGNYSVILFTNWDHGCQDDRATKLKQKNILYRLQVDLEEESRKKRTAALTLGQKVILYSLRVGMFLVSLGLIAAACYGIFVATNFSQKYSSVKGITGLIFEYLPSIVITTANFLVPLLGDQIALIERYSPSNTVIVALLRAIFLRLVSLAVLLFSLWRQITCDGKINSQACALCQYNYKDHPCWETRVGQEMYKLTLFDFLVNVALLFLVEFPRRMVVDNWSCKLAQWVGRQEFVVPANVLGLVYGQTVVWTGALFCPLLPVINTVKFILLFYFKKVKMLLRHNNTGCWSSKDKVFHQNIDFVPVPVYMDTPPPPQTTLFYNCRPAMRTFRSTYSSVVFLAVLLFGWGLATVVLVYSVAQISPSMGCGPFRFFPSMWSIVPKSFYSLSETTQNFLFFIGSQAFSIPLFALSCVVMCYFVALASVYGKTVALLRAQLKLEGRDKQFLVKQIEELSRHQILDYTTGACA